MTDYSFKLPDLGEGIVESEISEWHVQVGEEINEDQHIADVMTDKAVVEVTSPVTGVVAKLACKPGDTLAVGSELILIKLAADNAVTEQQPESTPNENSAVKHPTPNIIETEIVITPETAIQHNTKVLASPSVRRRAREQQIDLTVVSGSGPAGRVSNSDLDKFLSAGGIQANLPTGTIKSTTTEVKIKGLRRVIAQKMTESSQHILQYTYVEEIDVTALEEVRQHLNQHRSEEQAKLTLLPFIMQALVKTIPEFPHCNAHYNEQTEILTQFEASHIGIATMTKNGLLVPVVRDVAKLDIWQTAANLSELSQASRDGKAQSSDLSGSTITITSLGAIGGIVTTPIINAPETSIIGINKVKEKPVVDNGQVVIRKIMNLSSSFDHRIVDGYDGAQFIQAMKRLLENPVAIFV